MIRLRPLIPVFFLISAAFAQGTRTWEQSKFDDLLKGTTEGVAIRSNGGLELAPSFKPITTTPSTYIWSIAGGSDGSIYAAAGSPARVYRITADGKSSVIFEPQELQVQALVVDKSGAIYAGTNPDGKVYKIEHRAVPDKKAAAKEKNNDKNPDKSTSTTDSAWSSSVYFDPGTKYIWDLVLDEADNLLVATGDHGEIFRVTPKGEHSVLFKSDEAHIRVMALDGKGNLIAGSDGSGLVYRISPAGESFVLYSAPKKEITALAIDKAGNIYAAGVGEKHSGASSQNFPAPIAMSPVPTASAVGPQGGIVITAAPSSASQPINFPGAIAGGTTGGSEIYRIAPDGSPSRLWSSREDIVYALAFDANGRLLAGTGNRGHIFAITANDEFTDLLKASVTQVTAFAAASRGGLYAATSNLGKVFLLGGASPESDGTYQSDVFDAHIFSRWGRAELRSSGHVEFFARSGNVDNPDRNWSPWTKVDFQKDGPVNVPAARFVQWKTLLHPGDPAPHVESVVLNYLPKNVAPDFDDVTVTPGVRYQALPKMAVVDVNAGVPQQHFDVPPPTTRDRDSIGVKWSVHDDNDDQMIYSVFYRGDGESRWLLLKDNLTDKFYSFDASLLPDGGYTVKVVASDAPSHSPGQALTAEKESARFEVDTTPPRLEDLRASMDGPKIHVSFRATDSFSNIKRAEYSVDASDWQFIEPVDKLSDSKTESYDFQVALPTTSDPVKAGPAQLEHVVVVRVYDRYDNLGSAKTVVGKK